MRSATYSRYGVDQLTDYTGYLLRTVFMRAAAISARHFDPGSHPREAGILIALESEGPRSQQELAERLNVNRTVMVKLVDGLEGRGLVTRLRNPDDRRAYALHPTPAGREAMLEMLPRMERAEAELTAPLTATEVERLKARLRALIEPVPPALAQRLGFLLSKAHHRFHDRADAELGPLGIQIRHFGALNALAGGVPSQRELADRLNVSGPVVVEMVDALEARGLVERRRDRADRRSNALVVTAAGQAVLATATRRLTAANAELTAPIGKAGDRELRSLLAKLLG
jgi:DNA-binding MarR family transcriptional regulator